MISKSTKRKRRSQRRNNLPTLHVHLVSAEHDFWLVGVQRAPTYVSWKKVCGHTNAIRTYARLRQQEVNRV